MLKTNCRNSNSHSLILGKSSPPNFLSLSGLVSSSVYHAPLPLLLVACGTCQRHPNVKAASREGRWTPYLCSYRDWCSPPAQPHSRFGHKSHSPGPGGPPAPACCPASLRIHLLRKRQGVLQSIWISHIHPHPQWHIPWPLGCREVRSTVE